MNPGYDKSRANKKRGWAASVGYWRTYRAGRPEYRARDNERRRRAKVAAKRAANQTARREIARRKLDELRTWVGTPWAANQTAIHRVNAGVVDYLVWRDGAANQTGIDRMAPA